MKINTITGDQINSVLLERYLHNLVNRFFKILPMREKDEQSLNAYMVNLRDELLGCQSLVPDIKESSLFPSLLFILQSLINRDEYSVSEVKCKVFAAISICNKLLKSFRDAEVE